MALNNKISIMTEERNPASMKIDLMDTEEIICLINQEDAKVAEAVRVEIPAIKKAVDMIVARMKEGGRLFYVGAGTSGRLGILDAIECGPTFGVENGKVVGVLAGGEKAMFVAQEDTEDDFNIGAKAIKKYNINALDSVIGIAASGNTPYVLGAIEEAKKHGALTIGLVCIINSLLEKKVDVIIAPFVGPEIITGSTRMKAGTAQKMVLNMISTTVMIKLGKVYSNLMVDLNPSNYKLRERAKNIFMEITNVNYEMAAEYLKETDYNIKAAIVMYQKGVTLEEALKLLKEKEGILVRIID
ncbi:N-acetylmuramic acid 6-phosphate etherase [Candidatus Atribacteria bacterium HGW-Atribacteria-1]|nr:MAG: N-acetylmuramic acid 6-phosphate etherase [Candidatus Atribacteria bacterium HGW-Atribacteria-1]